MQKIFKQISDSFDQPAVICTLVDKKIVAINKAVQRILDESTKNIQGKYFDEIFEFTGTASGKLVWKKNGIRYMLSESRLDFENTSYYKAVFKKDDQEKIVEQLRVARSMAELLMHRFRSPLTAMQGFTEMLEGVDPEKEAILDGINEISAILDEMEELTKEPIPNREPVDIHRLIQKIIGEFPAKIRRKISVVSEEDFGFVVGDTILCEKILREIIANAVEHSSEELEDIIITFKSHGHLAVTNYSEPISRQNLSKIFLPFVTSQARSAGLGLTKSMIWLNALGGGIDLISNSLTEGITFEISFPVKKG